MAPAQCAYSEDQMGDVARAINCTGVLSSERALASGALDCTASSLAQFGRPES